MTDPDAWCGQCRRTARQHGPKPRHWRVCGPQTGTGPGPMTIDEWIRYVAARRPW